MLLINKKFSACFSSVQKFKSKVKSPNSKYSILRKGLGHEQHGKYHFISNICHSLFILEIPLHIISHWRLFLAPKLLSSQRRTIVVVFLHELPIWNPWVKSLNGWSWALFVNVAAKFGRKFILYFVIHSMFTANSNCLTSSWLLLRSYVSPVFIFTQ